MGNMKKGWMNIEKSKRSQVTIFIIIAIVIVVAVGIILLLNKETIISRVSGGGVGENTKNSMETCLNSLAMENIYFLALQGGYYNVPQPYEEYEYLNIPIYYDKGKTYIPSKATLEKEIADSLKDYIDTCINKSIAVEEGYKVLVGTPKSLVISIGSKKVNINLELPLTFSKGEESRIISKFSTSVDFDLEKKYNTILKILDDQIQNPNDWIIPGRIDDESVKEVELEGLELEDGAMIYTVSFPDKYNEQQFTYNFVSRI